MSRLWELILTVSTGGFISLKISWLDVGMAESFVMCETIVAGDKGGEGSVIGADNFLVSGEQQHLMGGHGEIALDEVATVG
jgi:hypothetical protein